MAVKTKKFLLHVRDSGITNLSFFEHNF